MYIKRLLCMVRASYRLATLLLPFGGSTPGNAKHFLPSGLLPASGGEISNHRKCALVLVGLALSDLACFTGVVVSSGFVTQRVLALHARATRHLRARGGVGRLYPTNLDGTPGDDAEAPFVT